jgi:hypothetical protein
MEASFCEDGNEFSGTVEGGKFLTQFKESLSERTLLHRVTCYFNSPVNFCFIVYIYLHYHKILVVLHTTNIYMKTFLFKHILLMLVRVLRKGSVNLLYLFNQ